MTKILATVLLASFALNAHAVDKNYFRLTKVTTTDVTEQYNQMMQPMSQAGLVENCDPATKAVVGITSGEKDDKDLNPLGTIEVIVDQIINIGKKIWAIIDAGKPVVNVKSYTANALPRGLTCWTDLSNWNAPQSKVYRVQYKNGFGADVVDFTYRVMFTSGGSLNGQGKYITNATIQPAALDVSWGFRFNASAEVPSVFNQGTMQAPVAGMQMNMKWAVDTVLAHSEQADSFFINGMNLLQKLP